MYRIASYNIKWFSRLFDENNQLLLTDDDSEMYRVSKKEQTEFIAKALDTIDADVYCIVEGPNTSQSGRDTVIALENFANHFNLRTTKALVGKPAAGQQEICLLYDPQKVQAVYQPQGSLMDNGINITDFLKGKKLSPSPRFDQHYVLDVEEDSVQEIFQFERPPLEAKIQLLDEGAIVYEFELIGVHAKSKIVSGVSDEIFNNLNSMANRRKLIAQCQWVRDRVEEHIDAGRNVAVLGDFNDGPGLDFYERQFGRSAVEIAMGDIGNVDTLLRNPYAKAKWHKSRGWSPATARFYQFDSRKSINVLLDFILVSPKMAVESQADWTIWNPHENRNIGADEFKEALEKASDHFPVSLDLEVT